MSNTWKCKTDHLRVAETQREYAHEARSASFPGTEITEVDNILLTIPTIVITSNH